ncbi:MAG: undecaprenyl-diphosphate phosphatase [Clostridia bacterium]|nr:undecaprenyl-diphosphate phosphatase [Clostridia bacterium]
MDFWLEIALGFVQGITEFLPISSSGHLVLIEHFCGVQSDFLFLNVLLHVATLLAVIIYYRKTLLYLITHPFCKMNKYLLVATIPAVVFVLLFNNFVNTVLSSIVMVGVGFILTGIFLTIAVICTKKNLNPQPLNYKNVTIMGISQAFAIFPGLSRSGTTLAFGLVAGTERQTALDFSFLMSIPIILASLVYQLIFSDFSTAFVDINVAGLIISVITAFLSALLGLILMKKVIKNINLIYFVPYLIILGILTIIFA